LPKLGVTDGRLICTATGIDPCPLHTAIANWLDRDHYVLWEPGRVVRMYGGRDTTPVTIGALGADKGQYATALAAGPDGNHVLIIDRSSNSVMRFGRDGAFEESTALPESDGESARGFVGDVPILQRIRPRVDSSAVVEVRVLSSPAGDTGRVVLSAAIPWLFLNGGRVVRPTPFFGAGPVFTVAADRSIIWSPGTPFEVKRQSLHGATIWTLTSDWMPAAITEADIAAERRNVRAQSDTSLMHPADIDSMAARTAKRPPAITGIAVDPAGDIALAGPSVPTADSIDYFILSGDGIPTARFRLDNRSQLVLFTPDSVLVHRPTNSEPWETRWLLLRGSHK
jgi:hypothetical protein